jgi:signal transduction histidine kinase
MKISLFITKNMEQILTEWETFAATFGAVTDKMSKKDLRDHAKQILQFIAQDVQIAETALEIEAKSHGLSSSGESDQSASSIHGRMRFVSGFTLSQLIAEYRALRASVLKLWQRDCADISPDSAQDTMRFNEAVDQSLAEAAVAYSDKLNEASETFIAILGHDLRSPLAATLTAGTYLSRPGAFSDQVQQIGVRLKRSAATMNGMVNDLLALARTQLGDGISIERQECDLLEMCQWAIEDANAAYPRAHFELNATGELIGKFDAPRLQQLLTNLASNAAQHGTPGTPINVDIVGSECYSQFATKERLFRPSSCRHCLPHWCNYLSRKTASHAGIVSVWVCSSRNKLPWPMVVILVHRQAVLEQRLRLRCRASETM